MAYITKAQVKAYIGKTLPDDDGLIDTLITRAQTWIETYTGRKFESLADATHNFTVDEDTDGRDLILDDDLCQITSVVTDADGSPITLTTSDYVTVPRNKTPYAIIRIRGNSDHTWDWSDDPTGGVTVTGRWAYSLTAPDDIVQACLRLVGYLYKQKDAQVFDTTAQPDMGIITIPAGIPADVKLMLDPYRRTFYP